MPLKKPTQQNSKQLEKIRHSLAHIMASAVRNLYGQKIKLGIGPVIENGFYYDFDFINSKLKTQNFHPKSFRGKKPQLKTQNLSDADLIIIEQEMRRLIGQNLDFVKKNISITQAKKLFSGQKYKLELIKDIEKLGTTKIKVKSEKLKVKPALLAQASRAGGSASQKSKVKNNKSISNIQYPISIYKTGNFTDLCQGPHIKNTQKLKSVGFKLTKLAGAYWRGDEKNKMLTRIYGLAFGSKKELADYLRQQTEAEKRDHRKLGKELDLFIFSDLVGPGLPLYTNRGFTILNEIINYSKKLNNSIGYQEVHTPNMNKADLFKVSGHYEKYKNDMFKVVSNYTKEEYYLKPMNCPQHTQIYAAQSRSYRDLPVRIADFANLYRDERPGELSGLTRLRAFRQDDGHCFCASEQMKDEFKAVLNVVQEAMKIYKLKYKIRFSLWDPQQPEKYLGSKETWQKSQKIMEEILKENKIDYFKAVGEAAIYGPKMDLIANDSIGREWQLSTIQLDLIMPKRFGLKYIDKNGREKTPVMIHRALIGSPERFLGVLLEHYAGAFPLWLAPVQIMLLPVSQKYLKICQSLKEFMILEIGKLPARRIRGGNWEIRIAIDEADETVGYKIRSAAKQKIPYTIVIGDKEAPSKGQFSPNTKLSVRKFGQKKIASLSLGEFLIKANKEIEEKS